jgi:hypothetical protein
MSKARKGQLVPQETLSPGWEAVYTGEMSPEPISEPGLPVSRATDEQGNVLQRWPVWTWSPEEGEWDAEIKLINGVQARLGPLDDETRKIRAHIGSLVPCDSGFPVTVDELLQAIGQGKLETPAFHNGCWCCGLWGEASRQTQPRQAQSMTVIEQVLRRYLAGESAETLAAEFPHAAGFIRRTFQWLGPRGELSELQRVMLEKMLLQFDFYTRRNPDREAVKREARDEGGGRGDELRAQFAALAGLPANWEEVTDPEKKELCQLWWRVDGNIYGELCDCHHSSFRWIESWIHAIGIMKVQPIPARKEGTERERKGKLLFGYVLALDKWLLGVPMQFLLLDLGHIDLGFDPKNEILRVYAYLGEERTPVKEWLAACLWHTLMYSPMFGNAAGLMRHRNLTDRAREAGISVREWMENALAGQG